MRKFSWALKAFKETVEPMTQQIKATTQWVINRRWNTHALGRRCLLGDAQRSSGGRERKAKPRKTKPGTGRQNKNARNVGKDHRERILPLQVKKTTSWLKRNGVIVTKKHTYEVRNRNLVQLLPWRQILRAGQFD